ncbi:MULTISPECIES: glycerol kinase GlpK [Sphingobium]|uniref:glycerol kinase GlpK n=1 Tax=Sphingobium TaxID=165695 RepID=UPI0015EC9B32|nr:MULTISPECIES: glycerol kinase GlpK [Sphingobium]MCW2363770.1 glycerol kinase [Sphingobium sp. B10D3B]MCW2402832.1 glycerol kinase [Sphingobium sp. B10D7B]MCW2409810.1 glycerol kinase [Sphingobium xanthum]
MAQPPYILAIDQGTTSTRCILFDAAANPVATTQREFKQHYPNLGWVEHDPEDIWTDTVAMMRDVVAKAGVDVADVAAIGITNQRETVVVWDRATGKPIHNAIVWQDRRTADECARLKDSGAEEMVTAKTGLLIDPYFSATKAAWILDNVAGARAAAERSELAFGTIDSFLLWRLTGGAVHATDPTNAGRTLLFNIMDQAWDDELLSLFRVPAAMLPEVRDNSCIFGQCDVDILGKAIPVAGMIGDQQSALFGQGCFRTGMAKSTYGTGCFALMNIGTEPVLSKTRMLTTPAYRLAGTTTYALEGSIFVAGAAVKWLRDGLKIITHASETDGMATRVPDSHGVYMVPAFVGLGAPYWDPHARGLICGLTLDATDAHLARAALESVAYQTMDLIDAMKADVGEGETALRVDGGMAVNDWLCQFLSDVLVAPVERPAIVETTALGAAFMAGLATGVWSGLDDLDRIWTRERRFEPKMPETTRSAAVEGWRKAVERAIS